MSTAEPIRSPPMPGRPRSSEADRAIIGATVALLASDGYQAMSLERVAALAQVGKKTIYRRWASKEALVCDAIRSLQSEMPLVDTGNLRDDLVTMHHNALATLATAP
jgi:AcrR family transcriptional regulator